jgi:hypothetical protein
MADEMLPFPCGGPGRRGYGRRLKVRRLAAGVLILLSLVRAAASDDGRDWQSIKGKHFIVHYWEGRAFARRVLRKAEAVYEQVGAEMGFSKYDDFWLWDRRVDIYVFPNKATFARATGAPVWAAGKASYTARMISTYAGNEAFLETVLPHELAHLVFRDYVGFEGEIPLWLDEGVAQWFEASMRDRAEIVSRRLAKRGRLMGLDELMRLDVRRVTDAGIAAEFYAQSVSLVGFLVTEYGSARFRKLCGHLKDGKTMDEALRFTYPDSARSMAELEKAWRKHLGVVPGGE